MKKLLALLLAVMMIMSLAVPTMAAAGHNHTITIMNTREGYTYKAYQIFDGILSKSGVLTDISWGVGVNSDKLLTELKKIDAFKDCTDAKSVAEILSTYGKMDDPKSIAFAEVVAGCLTTVSSGTGNYANNEYTITGLDDGYYLVLNESVPTGADTTYTRFIMEVVADVDVTHKGTFPTVDKKILIGEGANVERVVVSDASIGETVNYEIVGTMPDTISTYSTYYYNFIDKLSMGLTYNEGSMVITVNGVEVTEYFHKNISTYSEVDGTTITAGITDLLALELLVDDKGTADTADDTALVGEITKNTKVVITYSATLNENAIVNGPNPNIVKLEYDNDPNLDGDGTTTPPPPNPEITRPEPVGVTPDKKVETYTTRLILKKTDGTGAVLTGAEFTLTGERIDTVVVTGEYFVEDAAGTYYLLKSGRYTETAPNVDDPSTTDINEDTTSYYDSTTTKYKKIEKVTLDTKLPTPVEVKAFVNSEGLVIFEGLAAGTYTITETVTPDGYNTIAPITFTVTFDGTPNAGEWFFATSDNRTIFLNAENNLYGQIVNQAGKVLPSTGGIGTTLFYVFGSLMFLGAGVLLVTKKRMAE